MKPSPPGHSIGQKLADCQHGTINVPTALHCFIYFNIRVIKNIGGTNKPLAPCQSTVKAIQNVIFENRFQYITDLIGGGFDAYLMVFRLKLKVSFRLAL
jgi:hypothetical protein